MKETAEYQVETGAELDGKGAWVDNPIEVIGVVGEGKMGSGIFYYLTDHSFKLVWLVSPSANLEKLQAGFSRKINRAYHAGLIKEDAFNKLQQTRISNQLSDLSGCDLIIEAIPEEISQKQALFAELDAITQPHCIFATNSSSLLPSRLTPSEGRRDRVIGLHFFYPVALKNIVEFIITDQTAKGVEETTSLFLEKIGKRSILLEETNAFILNKIFLDVQNEAFRLVQEGHCSFAQMDWLVKEHLFPFGIFDFCDQVGIDTMLESIKNYTSEYPHKLSFAPFISALEALFKQGKLGVKNQHGFYDYPLEILETEPPGQAEALADHLRYTYLNASKRFTALAHLPIGEMNDAIKEYFGVDRGPFE